MKSASPLRPPRCCVDHAADRVQRREPPREGLGGGQRALVDLGPDHLVAQPQRLHGVAAVDELGSPSNCSRSRVASSSSSQRTGRSRTVTPCTPSGGTMWLPGGSSAPSMHEQDVRGGRPLVGPEPRPLARGRRAASTASSSERRGHHPHRPDRVGLLGALAVRQPLDPVPVGEVLLGGQHGDDEVLGRVERGRGADHRPGQRAGRLLGTADLDPVEGAQVDRRRQVRLQPVYDEQPVQRGGGGRVDLVDGRALRRHQLERERLVADAVADVQEARVAAAVLPDPGAVLGERGQRGRVGVVPGERPALLVGGLAGELADVAEVAEVLGAGAGDLLDPLLALPVDLDHDEAERGEQEHAGRDVLAAAGAGAAHRRDQHDRAEASRASGSRSSARRWRPRPARSAAAAAAASWPWGSSGSSSRPPRSVLAPGPEVCVDEPVADRAGVRPPPDGGATRGTGGLSVVVTARPLSTRFDPSMIGVPPNGGTSLPRAHESGWAGPARSTGRRCVVVTMEGGRRLAHGTLALTVHGPLGRPRPRRAARGVGRRRRPGVRRQVPASSSRRPCTAGCGDGARRRVVAGRRSASAAATCWPRAAPYAGTRATASPRRSRTPAPPGAVLGHVVRGRGRRSRRWPGGSGRGPAGWTATRAG